MERNLTCSRSFVALPLCVIGLALSITTVTGCTFMSVRFEDEDAFEDAFEIRFGIFSVELFDTCISYKSYSWLLDDESQPILVIVQVAGVGASVLVGICSVLLTSLELFVTKARSSLWNACRALTTIAFVFQCGTFAFFFECVIDVDTCAQDDYWCEQEEETVQGCAPGPRGYTSAAAAVMLLIVAAILYCTKPSKHPIMIQDQEMQNNNDQEEEAAESALPYPFDTSEEQSTSSNEDVPRQMDIEKVTLHPDGTMTRITENITTNPDGSKTIVKKVEEGYLGIEADNAAIMYENREKLMEEGRCLHSHSERNDLGESEDKDQEWKPQTSGKGDRPFVCQAEDARDATLSRQPSLGLAPPYSNNEVEFSCDYIEALDNALDRSSTVRILQSLCLDARSQLARGKHLTGPCRNLTNRAARVVQCIEECFDGDVDAFLKDNPGRLSHFKVCNKNGIKHQAHEYLYADVSSNRTKRRRATRHEY